MICSALADELLRWVALDTYLVQQAMQLVQHKQQLHSLINHVLTLAMSMQI